MIKIKKNIVIFLFLVILLLALSACKKEKVECTTSADCLQKTCYISKCANNKCLYNLQRNCCGNNLQDEIENGKSGNKCTCPQDYGKCEGKGKIKKLGRSENTTYLYYHCDEQDECVFNFNDKDIEIQNFFETISVGFFKASVVITYNKPVDASKGTFKFKVSLDDTGKDLVAPVHLTKLKLLYSTELSNAEQLTAEKDLDSSLTNIGDEILIETPLNLGYKPREVEETGSIRYIIDYVYNKRVASGKTQNGTIIYTTEPVRSTFTSMSKPVFFVRSE